MATKMQNYYWVSVDHERIVIPSEEMKYSLGGNAYGRAGFANGAAIMTSRIISVENNVAKTASGSEYELGNMHPDYAELLAAKDAGIPVLNSWKISGNLREGYILTGRTGETTVRGLVTAQEGNTVAINGIKYCVIWQNLDIDPLERFFAELRGQYCDLRTGYDFTEYMGIKCKPVLFPNFAK